MPHSPASVRRFLVSLCVLALPLAANNCGSPLVPPDQPKVPETYAVRYTTAGISGAVGTLGRPRPQISLNQCDPNYNAPNRVCGPYGELLPYTDVTTGPDSSDTHTIALNPGVVVRGQTLYLSARFYYARPYAPHRTSKITVELLGDGEPVQTVTLDWADAQRPENQYPIVLPNPDYDVMKFVKFVVP